MSEPNYCEDCRHYEGMVSIGEPLCTIPLPSGKVDYYVERPLSYLWDTRPCRDARAYHAGQPNVIDPVPVCPKWEAKP